MSLTLATNRAAWSCDRAGKDVGVVFEHRAAAGGVDDDRVDSGRVEGRDVASCEIERGPLDARVVMDRAAADLSARDHDLAAVLPGAPGPWRRWSRETSRRRRNPGTGRPGRAWGRSPAGPPANDHATRSAWAASPASAGGSAAAARVRPTARPSRASPGAAAAGPAPEPISPGRNRETGDEGSAARASSSFAAGRGACERDLERLDHLAVLNARGAGRLAGPAIEAELEVLAHARPHRQPTVGDRPHQVDSSARAVVLVASLDVGRTARRAEPAVDAFLIAHIGDLLRQPVEVDRGRSRSLVNARGKKPIVPTSRSPSKIAASILGWVARVSR